MFFRKRIQIRLHLSTYLILVLIAACLLYLNVGSPDFHPGGPNGEFASYGWPIEASQYRHYRDGVIDFVQWEGDDFWFAVFCNLILSMLVLSAIGFLLERRLNSRNDIAHKTLSANHRVA